MGEIRQIPSHQVKVDNWPLFFLQRLNHFYRKKAHCDLTILFSTLNTVKSIKVHKLVLHACTDYFESLDVMTDSEHGEFLQLSNEMHPDVVIPIISFMYTGKLEFPVSLQSRLYEAATKLRMTILTKLLDVQPNLNSRKVLQSPDDSMKVSVPQSDLPIQIPANHQEEQNVNVGVTETSSRSSTLMSLTKNAKEPVIALIPASTLTSVTKPNVKPRALLNSRPEAVTVQGNNPTKMKTSRKSYRQSLTVSSKSEVSEVSLSSLSTGRKHPVVKKKVIGSQAILDNTRSPFRFTFKPTRFEWDEDLNDPTAIKSVEDALRVLSHDGNSKLLYPILLDEFSNSQKKKMSGDSRLPSKESSGDSSTQLKETSVDLSLQSKETSNNSNLASKEISDDSNSNFKETSDDSNSNFKETLDDSFKRNSDGSSCESPPYKRSKQSDLQDMKEYGKQQQLRNEIICSEENSDDVMDADELYGQCDDESDDLPNFNQSSVNSSTPKPILKTLSKPEPPVSSKKVRFSLKGKENNQQQNDTDSAFAALKQSESSAANENLIFPMEVNELQSDKHHVKIVSEVLKKYPNLAKRKNIKLRVVSKNPAAVPATVQQAVEGDSGTGNKSLVSYILLTNKSSSGLIPAKGEPPDKGKLFDAENRTGPWICHVCDENNPIEFESYYNYRRHLVEVHEVKIDARICEYCGLKNSKRNHLLYHLYTKHGINPPARVNFPKCSECNYIAHSEALLLKHKSTHEVKNSNDPKNFTCYICNVVFKSYAFMQDHLNSRFHAKKLSQREGKQIYRCPYCESLFGDGEKLGKHIVAVHWGKSNQTLSPETDVTRPGQQLNYVEQTSTNQPEANLTDSQNSSELESLGNAASGIASPLNLAENEQTVVYFEQRTEGQNIGREATVISGDECKDYIISTATGIDDKEYQSASPNSETVNTENEDSNSRMSMSEEVNRSSCSDHDYSERQEQMDLRHVIPVQQVANQIQEAPVIQQILPDRRILFSNPGNVVFQSPCVNIPPGVILAPGKMVLPQIAHGDQNLILSPVIPSTQYILSGSILQQPTGIIENGNNAIVFANPEHTDTIENVQTGVFQLQTSETNEKIQEKTSKEVVVAEESQKPVEENVKQVCQTEKVKIEGEENVVTMSEKIEVEEVVEEVETEKEIKEPEEESEGEEKKVKQVEKAFAKSEEKSKIKSKEKLEAKLKFQGKAKCKVKTKEREKCKEQKEKGTEVGHSKTGIRIETAKIVDDWDETNDSQPNIESRGVGPSRPEFF